MTEKTRIEPGARRRPHPGRIIREMYLERLGLTVTQAAAAVGISRTNFSLLLNARCALSADMAIRLGRLLDTSPLMWLMLQAEYDLEQAEARLEGKASANAKARQSKPE